MTGVDLPTPVPAERRLPAAGPSADPIRVWLDLDRRYHLSVYSLGLACCAVEFVALANASPPAADMAGPDPSGVGPPTTGLEAAQVLVVAGTVTDKMAPLVRRVYEAMPEPRYVVSFGACSDSGGPYWDSYSVAKGVGQIVPVDVYVPGCPPPPDALAHGIRLLRDAIADGTVTR